MTSTASRTIVRPLMSEPIANTPVANTPHTNPPETSAPPQPIDEAIPKPQSFIAHARMIGAITLVSRVLGLVREMIVASSFGSSPVLAAFKYAFVLPNLFRKLLGEGALSAAFIPMYTGELRQSDRAIQPDFISAPDTDPSSVLSYERSRPGHVDFASAAVTLQLILLILITLVGEAALIATIRFATLRPETALAVRLAMVMLPYVVFVCAAALLGGILQVHRRFIATTATSVILNALMIVAIVCVSRSGLNLKTAAGQHAAVWWLAVSVLVAGAAQTAMLVPSLRACGFHFKPTFNFWTPAVKRMLRMTVPVALSLGVMQIGVVLDKQIAFICSPQSHAETIGHFLGMSFRLPMEIGALNRLDWAQYLYQFPLGVFGIAIATAIFPQLSGDALDLNRDAAQFRSILGRGINASLFIGLPASAGMILIALPAIRLLFEHGEFTYTDSLLTARSTAIYSSVIWAFSVQQILNRAYYALHDMKTPLIWAAANLVINLLVELPLLWTRLGESAMAVGTAVSFLIQTTIMTALLARTVGLPLRDLMPTIVKMIIATLGMTLACAAVRWLPHWPGKTIGSGLVLLSVMVVGAVTYFGLCAAMRVPMENLLPARFKRFLPRRGFDVVAG